MANLRFLLDEEEVLKSGPDHRKPVSPAEAAWDVRKAPTTVKLLQFIEDPGDGPWDSEDDYALGERLGALRHVRSRPIPETAADAFAVRVREPRWGGEFDLEDTVCRDRSPGKSS